MKDSAFLQWVWDRLHYKYKENKNVDYMLRLKRIVDKTAQQQENRESCQLPTTNIKTPDDASSTSANIGYATALWKELNIRGNQDVPVKTEWVAVSKRRLNAAMKRLSALHIS